MAPGDGPSPELAADFKLQPGFDGNWALGFDVADEPTIWIDVTPALLWRLYSQIAGNVPMAFDEDEDA